jgi:hypothetical protein
MKFAADGINGCLNHFATSAKESQHIDEFVVTPAQSCAHHFRVFAVLAEHFDGLSQRNRAIGIHSGALFRPGETGLRAGSVCSDGRQTHNAKHKTGCQKKSGNRHGRGVNGAPVNAA